MDFTKATDEQLKAIVKHDKDCPTLLMSGVVIEMLNRNLWDGMIYKVILKRFHHISIACNVLQVNKDDLLQMGREHIFRYKNKFQPGRSSLAYLLYIALYSNYKDLELKQKNDKRKVSHQSISIYESVNESGTIFDYVADLSNVEKTVINKITWEETFSKLSNDEKETFFYYLDGFSLQEIAEKLNISKSGVNRRVKKSIFKLTGKDINLQNMNIRNYKRGA